MIGKIVLIMWVEVSLVDVISVFSFFCLFFSSGILEGDSLLLDVSM